MTNKVNDKINKEDCVILALCGKIISRTLRRYI